jgi:hypothetical protein
MKTKLASAAAVFAAFSVHGQGSLLIENVNGEKIIPIFLSDGITQVSGPTFHAALMFGGTQVGGEYPFALDGRFTSGSGVTVPGTKEGGTASGLILRVRDTTSGSSFEAATVRGISQAFDNPLWGAE